jgi:hypothetical protein
MSPTRNDWFPGRAQLHESIFYGKRFLSIYDKIDDFGTSCGPIFRRRPAVLAAGKEVVLQHRTRDTAVLYRPLPEWLELDACLGPRGPTAV